MNLYIDGKKRVGLHKELFRNIQQQNYLLKKKIDGTSED